MSDATRLVAILPLQSPKSTNLSSNRVVSFPFVSNFFNCLTIKHTWTLSQQGSIPISSVDSSSPVSIDLKPILNEPQFDRLVHQAQQLHQSLVVLWMANWCRKCIYLKPKLEKLAANYHPRVKFYCIDVNNVPYQLVVRAGVTKMPTIQLWKDGNKQAEVVGGHKAYLVANEVREMIDHEDQP